MIECSAGDNCPWCLHASLVTAESNQSEIVEIKTFITEHTCFGVLHAGHKQVSSSFIGSVIQAKLQDQLLYCPTDVLNDMRCEHRVQVRYWTPWHAKYSPIRNFGPLHHKTTFSSIKDCILTKARLPLRTT